MADEARGAHAEAASADPAKTAPDPVCGMMVDPHTAAHRSEHDGHASGAMAGRRWSVAEPEGSHGSVAASGAGGR